MEESTALIKPKITSAEEKIIQMVVDALPSEKSRRAYAASLESFFVWYAEQNRPELNKALINRYAEYLRRRKKITKRKKSNGVDEDNTINNSAHAEGLSRSSINIQLSAIRKFASEAEDNNLLDPRIASSIRSVKGVPFRGTRTGKWLTREQAQIWLGTPDTKTLKGLRDRALLGVLFGCGLRRAEATILSYSHIQQRDGRWVIVDIVGKRDKMRSIPMPSWTKALIDKWTSAAGINDSYIFRHVNRGGNLMGRKLTDQAIYKVITGYARQIEDSSPAVEEVSDKGTTPPKKRLIAPHDIRRTFGKLAHKGGSPIEQIQLSLGHDSIQTTEKYLGIEQDLTDAPCDHLGIKISI